MRKYQLPVFTDHMLLGYMRDRDDHAAFEEIYHRYWKQLLDTAFQRIKSKEAAEEIVQEVLLSLFLRRHELVITSTLEGWLKTALKYQVYKSYRAHLIHLSHLSEVIQSNQIAPLTPDEAMTLKEIREKVKQVANKLPEKCREVFMLSRFEHLSQKEIAERMGISLSTVKKHLTRALSALKNDLSEDHFPFLVILVCLFGRI
ncbi:RNA polymerase sigma-70 factor [Mucilaginibacter sp. RS28]|uniref:RNA polymerase sigma-70 factor n=1 Tax=Mucilaginibacter straminoryzae TaxID=2932774 RepID=A0A9X2B889_9SPHI|nr:RNA polymerase sigma-70 factor [Mucilaginibacter straminoryzae]MCJ8209221.1 RNA polymerase sigma-70 factor [Mucilaginibacter straminoryzae]